MFNQRTTRASIIVLACILTGCAGVNFYSDSGLTKKTGIPIYGSKPYLLVARTGAKDKPVEVSIIYLPDQQNVMYADPRSGIGSAKLTLAFTNGQMTSFGQETDPKIAELLTSVGGLMTAHAGALKTAAEAANISKGASTLQSGKSNVELGKAVADIATDIEAHQPPKSTSLAGLTAQQLATVARAQATLKIAGADLSDPKKC